MKVNSIDVYGIEDRLRKSKTKEDKEVWNYIKALKEAHERQRDLTNTAISKLRSYSKDCEDYQKAPDGSYLFDKKKFYIIYMSTHILLANKEKTPF